MSKTFYIAVPNVNTATTEKLKNNINYNILIKILEHNNWINKTNENINKLMYSGLGLLYIYGETSFDRKLYNVKTNNKNSLIHNTDQGFTNKLKLYFNMKNLFKHIDYYNNNFFMCKSWNIDDLQKLPESNKTYIIRPVGGWSGLNIVITNNNNDFLKYKKNEQIEKSNVLAKSKLTKHLQIIDRIFLDGTIVSEYITNPLLFNGRKFHLRCYIAIIYKNNKWTYSFFNQCNILTAKLLYKNSDWSNKNIHDTHLESSLDDYVYPDDFNLKYNDNIINYINIQLNIIALCIFKIAVNTGIKKYPETENAFELYGFDCMILDDFSVILLEVNNRIGTSFKNVSSKKSIEFSNNFFNWMYNTCIKLE